MSTSLNPSDSPGRGGGLAVTLRTGCDGHPGRAGRGGPPGRPPHAGPAGWCSGRAAATAVEPLGDLVRVEAQEVPPLDVGDAALGHEPTDMPLVDAQLIGDLLEGKQLR